jgi:hypothetical protein
MRPGLILHSLAPIVIRGGRSKFWKLAVVNAVDVVPGFGRFVLRAWAGGAMWGTHCQVKTLEVSLRQLR